MARRHTEHHRSDRLGWLRAAVLGANDGLLSTSSLIIGVASSTTSKTAVLIAGAAGLLAGALSMAAGEYVSVSSQRDAERADLRREREELRVDPAGEEAELAGIYARRGLAPELALQVANALMAHDALGAHARDELGLSDETRARPLQAAAASALAFAVGAAGPLALAAATPRSTLVAIIAVASLVLLAALGVLGARSGGSPAGPAAIRITFWGAIAMAATAALGKLIGR